MFDFLEQVKKAVEPYREIMLKAERDIWAHPETGYREWKTHEYMKDRFTEMGYNLTLAGNIPGFYAVADTGRPGPTVAVMAELDSVLCAAHPECNQETGAVHACGHHAQCAALLGIACALKNPEVLKNLSGRVKIFAVPAEELLELGYRKELKKKGVIKYFGGKVEFMYRGFFDDVDAALMLHTSNMEDRQLEISAGSNGCICKNITYHGKAAHAGGAPEDGINALYAATLGINAVNALRETFQDKDHVRVHPIMTVGGAAVNVIPETAALESYVRGAGLTSIVSANERVNRALAGAALSMGATLTISDMMGYFPLHNDENFAGLAREVGSALVGADQFSALPRWDTGCTDMGDIASVIPSIHPYVAGATGTGHGSDYYIEDREKAVMLAAHFQLALICALLEKGGERARFIKENAHLQFKSIKEYFEMADGIEMEKETVAYENGKARVSWKKD